MGNNLFMPKMVFLAHANKTWTTLSVQSNQIFSINEFKDLISRDNLAEHLEAKIKGSAQNCSRIRLV